MKTISTGDLKESLTLLLPQSHDDGEGGWWEEWAKGPRLRGSVLPLVSTHQKDMPHYKVVIRAGITLPSKIAFLWQLPGQSKRLAVFSAPVLIQDNRFLSMTAREETDA